MNPTPRADTRIDAARRWALRAVAAASAGAVVGSAAKAGDTAPEPVPAVLVTPGPGSAVSAIAELAVRIGADRDEGVALRLRFTGGGGIAIRELLNGNAQFGVFGVTAAMHENLGNPRLVALAAVEQRAPLSLMVRAGLNGQLRSVADLRGRVLGVHSNSPTTMTNGQQVMALLLRQHGLTLDDVRVVAAGQSWETQSAALRSRLVDAVISEEPFGLRMEHEGVAFALVRLGLADQPAGLPGEGFLRGTLIATRVLVDAQPALAQRLVRMVQRTLAWRRGHNSEAVVAALGLEGAEGRAFAAMLGRYPQLFSDDGRFSEAQMAQTDRFFRESLGVVRDGPVPPLAAMLQDRWAGRKP